METVYFTVGTQHYQFVICIFGLFTAPWVFTKVLVLVLAQLRSLSIHVVEYLNDLLLKGQSMKTVSQCPIESSDLA